MSGAPSAVKSCGLPGAAAPSSVENSSKVAASSGSVRNCLPSKRPRKNCVGLTGARRGASAAALAARTISRGMGTAREASARAQRSKDVAEALSELRNASARPLTAARGDFFALNRIACLLVSYRPLAILPARPRVAPSQKHRRHACMGADSALSVVLRAAS